MTDHPLPAPGETTGWITPPTDGGERLDGRSTVPVTADRLITGRRGEAPGTLEVIGDIPAVGPHGEGAGPAEDARRAGRGGAVLLGRKRILFAGTAAEAEAHLAHPSSRADLAVADPERIVRLDLPGSTLMPGLIETHDHLPTSGTAVEYPDYGPHEVARFTLNAVRSARELLSVGVTSAQSLGARHYVDVAVRDAIDNGDVRGPRIIASGPQITTTGGHSHHAGAEVDSIDQIRHEVRRHHKMGVDTIKVMATGGFMTGGSAPWFAQFSQDELQVLFAEAHRLGKWTAAHAHGTQGIERAVRAGVDLVAHASFITDRGRSEFDAALADEIARTGVYVECTMTADMPRMLRRDDSYAPPVRRLWEHGVRIVVGHDAGIPAVPQRGYVGGLEALEWAGLPRAEVILAATSRAAAAIGCAGVTGVLAEGFEADLIAVAGDPREDLAVLRDLRLVVTRGREFVPDRLEGVPVLVDDSLGGLGPIGPAATLGVWRARAERRRAHPQV